MTFGGFQEAEQGRLKERHCHSFVRWAYSSFVGGTIVCACLLTTFYCFPE